jgi:pyruvate dehydrogenase E1 component
MSSWIAAATAYSSHGVNMIPFYIYYSMFGFQRIGDLAWAAGDMQARGFLIGGTAGRTTLAGEGLQHQDGHGLLVASTIPNCIAYDPCFAYEMAVIIHDGMQRMMKEQENVYYYITAMNENYVQPAMPKGVESGIVKGMYRYSEDKAGKEEAKVQLFGSGTILREVIAAAEQLKKDWGVSADVWSVTSYNELAREARDCERWNMLNPEKKARISYIEQQLQACEGPVISSSDYVRNVAEQIRNFVPSTYTVLGTDGFGRSDTRKQLRKHFEVNSNYVTLAALKTLADEGTIPASRVKEAIKKYHISIRKPNPLTA